LAFIRVFLHGVVEENQTPSTSASAAYTATLRKYHNFVVRGIFSVAMKTCPTREKLLDTLGQGATDEATVLSEAKAYVQPLHAQLDALEAFYAKHALE
jgi:pleckstrin family protein A (phosphoinositide binding specific) protein 8